jgi:hypothetical protein
VEFPTISCLGRQDVDGQSVASWYSHVSRLTSLPQSDRCVRPLSNDKYPISKQGWNSKAKPCKTRFSRGAAKIESGTPLLARQDLQYFSDILSVLATATPDGSRNPGIGVAYARQSVDVLWLTDPLLFRLLTGRQGRFRLKPPKSR